MTCAKGIEGKIEAGKLLTHTVIHHQRIGTEIWQGIATIGGLANCHAEINCISGAVDGPVGVHIGKNFGRRIAHREIEIIGSDAITPTGHGKAKIILTKRTENSKRSIVRIIVIINSTLEDTTRISGA